MILGERLSRMPKKILLVFIAVFILTGICLSFVHHHADVGQEENCLVCHALKQFAASLGIAAIILSAPIINRYLSSKSLLPESLIGLFRPLDRAPPFSV